MHLEKIILYINVSSKALPNGTTTGSGKRDSFVMRGLSAVIVNCRDRKGSLSALTLGTSATSSSLE
jgi:hypothetical protein